MNDAADPSLLDQLKRFDDERPSVPGEHWLTFAAGLYLLLRPNRTSVGKLASVAGGGLLVARALSGRDGLLALLRNQPDAAAAPAPYVEVAAPWPYDRRVTVSTPTRVRRGSGADATADATR